MKIRNGFVSNSSSSSFIVKIGSLSDLQVLICRNYIEFVKFFGNYTTNVQFDCIECVGEWKMSEDDGEIRFSTYMDNFDLYGFFTELDIPIHDYDR